MVKIVNQTKNCLVGDKVKVAATFLTRLRGLLFTSPLQNGEGLLISPCTSVHTFGMRYAIDVVFLDQENCVVECVTLPPGKWYISSKSEKVLELPAGQALSFNIEQKDQFLILKLC